MFRFKIAVSIAVLLLLFCSTASGALYLSPHFPGFGTVLDTDRHFTELEKSEENAGLLSHAVSVSTNLALLPFTYKQMENAWGVPDGRFHFKDDWAGDNLALNDEISHMLVSYKLTQFFHSGYKALGYSERTSLWLGIIETAVIVTAVEYPIDAYNPSQGFGISDLIFDYAGIGLGYLKITDNRFDSWDIKGSVKSFGHANQQVFGDLAEDYDNYIYWLTYRKEPAVFGLGYSTSHPEIGNVDKEFYLGVGTTIPDLLSPFSKKLSEFFRWSEFYYFNLRWNFLTID
ncbi:MAG: DUF2279 domain-containing protein [candidate division Zixibacteria bacterium]|nr:DUF2279 domain-containing protein [candidate division Zixibacteria bacterium]